MKEVMQLLRKNKMPKQKICNKCDNNVQRGRGGSQSKYETTV